MEKPDRGPHNKKNGHAFCHVVIPDRSAGPQYPGRPSTSDSWSAPLPVEEVEGGRGEQRGSGDVVVRHAGQDRQRRSAHLARAWRPVTLMIATGPPIPLCGPPDDERMTR